MKKLLFIAWLLFLQLVNAQTTNYVMNFNGSSDYVDVGTSVGNGLRSIEFWFKPNATINSSTSIPAYGMIERNDNTQSSEYGIFIKGSDWNGFGNVGQLTFYLFYSGTYHEVMSNSNSWVAGTWYHVAGVIDPSAGMQLYINGVLQSNTDASATAPTSVDNNPTHLGDWGNAGVRFFDGRLEEVRLWTRSISQTEIQNKMCQHLVPANETGLKAYWKFDEGSGSQIVDATTNANNGIVYGATWISDDPCASTGTYVMDFSGNNQAVGVGSIVGNGVRSIEFWFRPSVTINSSTSISGYAFLIRNDNGQTYEYGAYIRGSDWNGYGHIGEMSFFVRYSGVIHEIYSNSNSWSAGTWYHFAGVIDPSAGMQMYINGVLQSSTDASATSPVQTDNVNPSYLGQWGNVATRFFDGRMDEMRLWTRAISQTEIQAKMCQNLVPANETGLKAYWEFNEGSGTQIIDATANANNGTVYGSTWIVDNYCSGSCVPPTVNINGVTNICSGNGTILSATGTATSYTWSANAGSVHTSTVSLSPTTTTTYTLYSSDNACSTTNVITVSVTATPVLNVSGNTNVCSGNSTTLTGLGASSYTWNTGSAIINSQSINVTPSSTATYTLSGVNGSCASVKTVTITVTATPTLSVSGATNICSGNGTVLFGSGAVTYNWSSNAGSATTATVNVSPPSTTTYTLTGSNGNCIVFTTITVNVTPTPTVVINSASTICSGTQTVLNGSGAGTYTWSANAGGGATSTVSVIPLSTTTYTLVGANGPCTNNAVATIVVNPSPIITANSQTICVGATGTLTATGATSYTWSPQPQFTNFNASTVLDNPNQTTTYTVTGVGSNGCLGTGTVVLNVDSCLNSVEQFSSGHTAIYPNPTEQYVNIEVNKTGGAAEFKIFNSVGQEVRSGKLTLLISKIDLGTLPNGMYNVIVVNKDSTFTSKIIVQR